ncbi:MAG TPA: formate dehydrogenase subunit delta, partial [Candidatus Binataceae bacterium]|nr:formate dehydrogenase subunit delta [Candidatus Binataceae bacterium]
IGAYFESFPDRTEVVSAVATHLTNFWEPRMRRQIIEYAKSDGSELKDVVREAVLSLEAGKSGG